MNQDDSKQCEHLLSQQNEASYSALAPLNLHSISLRSPPISPGADCQIRQSGMPKWKGGVFGFSEHLLKLRNISRLISEPK